MGTWWGGGVDGGGVGWYKGGIVLRLWVRCVVGEGGGFGGRVGG